MTSDGAKLEGLVAFIEKSLLGSGFTVETNRKLYDEGGIQIAELDIEVRGRVGSADYSWLIECRDRPSQGAAPVGWMEQLATRRKRLGFDKVTAVSTTGFSPAAMKVASDEAIDLREMGMALPTDFSAWMAAPHVNVQHKHCGLVSAYLAVDDDLPTQQLDDLARIVERIDSDPKILRPVAGDNLISLSDAFVKAADVATDIPLVPNGDEVVVDLTCHYPADDAHYVVGTSLGDVRVRWIRFSGTVKLIERRIPFDFAARYRKVGESDDISQVVASAPIELNDGTTSIIEMHRFSSDGMTRALIRTAKRQG